LACEWDENAGAICRYRSAWRGGGQPEGSDGDPRGEAESHSRYQKKIQIFWIFFLF